MRSSIIGALSTLGIDTQAVLASCDASGANDRASWLPAHGFWEAVVAVSGQSGIGVRLAERLQVGDFGLLGRLASNSTTLSEALLHGLRLSRLGLSGAQLAMYADGERTSVLLELATQSVLHREEVDFIVTSGVLAARALTGSSFVPVDVSFAHDAPSDMSHHRRVLRAPLRFGAVQTSCSFATSCLLAPLPRADAFLQASLASKAEERLAAWAAGVPQHVRAAILAELRHGDPSIKRVAARMGLHTRTLTRKLGGVGLTFRDLLVRTRLELAEQYLCRPDARVTMIAELLGYSDKSAFNRAFKRSSGCSPQEYRRRVRKQLEQQCA